VRASDRRTPSPVRTMQADEIDRQQRMTDMSCRPRVDHEEVMRADAVASGVEEKSDIEALTANLIKALTTGVPQGAMWLVLRNAIWEIPGPYLKGPADVSPRPRRRDVGREVAA
jgi:hypothetical protein